MPVNTPATLQFNFFNKQQAASGYNNHDLPFNSDLNKEIANAIKANTQIYTTRSSIAAQGHIPTDFVSRRVPPEQLVYGAVMDCYA